MQSLTCYGNEFIGHQLHYSTVQCIIRQAWVRVGCSGGSVIITMAEYLQSLHIKAV